VLTGIGLVLGHALFGAGWLTLKPEGALRATGRGGVSPGSPALSWWRWVSPSSPPSSSAPG